MRQADSHILRKIQAPELLPLQIETIYTHVPHCFSIVREFRQKSPMRRSFPVLLFPVIHSLWEEVKNFQRRRIMSNGNQNVRINIEIDQLINSIASRRWISIE